MKSIHLLLALLMASVDVVILSGLKMRYLGTIKGDWIFVAAFLVYGCQSLLFYHALQYSTLTQMNLLWDVTSDILVTIVGIYFFHEAVTQSQKLGIIFAFLAIFLLR